MPSALPEVSVVLPACNAAGTIEKAAGSILEQSFRDLELIVVDDGSTDETALAVQRLSQADSRVRLVSLPHQGVCAAANAGTRIARSSVLARMDADDFSHPARLERQLQLLDDEDLDVVCCQVRIVDEAGEPVQSMSRYERWINEETLKPSQIASLRFVEFPLVNPTILARREYFELGFRDQPDHPEDYDLMLRAAADGMRFGKVPEVLFDWVDSPVRATRNDARYSRDAFMKCRRHYLLSGPLREVFTVDLWGLGKTGKPWLRWLQSQGRTVRRAYEINERKISTTIHGVRVSDPAQMPEADGAPLIIAVGSDRAREIICPQIQSRGYLPGVDAWFVA